MEKFKKFEVNNQKSIVGGELNHTKYPIPLPGGLWVMGADLYDTTEKRFVIILGNQ